MPTDCRTTDRNTNVGAVHPLSECAQSRDAFAPKAASGFWLADWILCGDIREDWRELLEAYLGPDMLSEKTLRDYRYLAKAVPASSRLDGVSFTHHQAVASLPEGDPRELLERPDKSKASA